MFDAQNTPPAIYDEIVALVPNIYRIMSARTFPRKSRP